MSTTDRCIIQISRSSSGWSNNIEERERKEGRKGGREGGKEGGKKTVKQRNFLL